MKKWSRKVRRGALGLDWGGVGAEWKRGLSLAAGVDWGICLDKRGHLGLFMVRITFFRVGGWGEGG